MTLTWNKVLEYAKNGVAKPDFRMEKTEEEWRQKLEPEVFRITRKSGTEKPFSGELCEAHEQGTFACACCGNPLFTSEIKFDSHSGWPSFTAPLKENAINYILDNSFGMQRIETQCNSCDAHLGHVFPDGPAPTGLRYCINSASLKLLDSK